MTARYFSLVLFCFNLVFAALSAETRQKFAISGDLPADHTLLTYIQELSDEDMQKLVPEFYTILKNLKTRLQLSEESQSILEPLHDELTVQDALELFGPCLGIVDDATDPQVWNIFSQSFIPDFYFIKNSFKVHVPPEEYFTQDELEEISQTAHRILQETSAGDVIISLGQSPAYIVEALEELVSHDEKDNAYRIIYKIPFSGAPDFCLKNKHYKNYKLSNLMTSSSLSYYKKLLNERGLAPLTLPSNHSVYIVDLIGTGGSLTAFLKLMVNWCFASNCSIPDFRLLDISVENRNFKDQTRITLPIGLNCNMYIDRLFVHTTAHLSDKLDYTEGEDRIQPPFGPLNWKSEYEHVFVQYPNAYGKRVIQCIKEYMHQNDDKFLKLYQ